jgi:ribose transport system permease protein
MDAGWYYRRSDPVALVSWYRWAACTTKTNDDEIYMNDSTDFPRRALPAVLRPSGPVVGLLLVVGLFIVILSFRGMLPSFLSWHNLQGIMHQSAIPAVIGLGMLLIMISGGIDLSVGSVVALVTVVALKSFNWLEPRAGVAAASCGAIIVGLAVGGLCGLVNGLAITGLRVKPFVATLGMMSVARGLANWLAERTMISFRGERPGWVDLLGVAEVNVGFFDLSVWSVVVLAIGVAVLLRFTVFGRYCYAIGSNEATARLCGISIPLNKLAIYHLAGLLTGWAGILTLANSSSANPGSSVGLELDVIAAVVIGGASLSGGQGNVLGSLLGVLILGVLDNGVSFCRAPVELKLILIGVIFVVSTALSQWQSGRRE